jgi:hypothetical protein
MNRSNWLDIAAVMIALCALAVSINQSNESERVSRVSVLPHLDLTLIGGVGTAQEKGIRLDNAGLGPAFIHDFELYVDGEAVLGTPQEIWFNALNKLGFTVEEINGFRRVYFEGSEVLKPGRQIYLITPKLDKDGNPQDLTDEEWLNLRRLTIWIDYRGAFGDYCHVMYSPSDQYHTTKRTHCYPK